MTATRTYLDHNATTPLHPAAREAMVVAFEAFGNPSSIHAEGRASRATVERARASVAALTGCAPHDVFFTSGGTEALNIVLTPELTLKEGRACDHLLVGAGEHPAVLAGHRFADRVTIVPLDREGRLNLGALAETLTWFGGKRVMLALQAANNETGVLQPVREAADLVHAAGGYVVCDAVQAAGKIACDINVLGVDALAISAHKFGGPKGVGALCFRPSPHHLKAGVVRGGGQERGLRSGTENVIGIAGFGAACEPAQRRAQDDVVKLQVWRSALEDRIRAVTPEAVIFGGDAERLPNTVCFAVPGYDAQVLMMNLDLDGVAVSAGSACTSGKVKPSHVLAAMGVRDDIAISALRVSLGWTTRDDEIDAFGEAFAKAMRTMRPRKAA